MYISTSPKPGKYLKTSPFRRRRSICTHFAGAGEVLIYIYLAPERPEKYLYTPFESVVTNQLEIMDVGIHARWVGPIMEFRSGTIRL